MPTATEDRRPVRLHPAVVPVASVLLGCAVAGWLAWLTLAGAVEDPAATAVDQAREDGAFAVAAEAAASPAAAVTAPAATVADPVTLAPRVVGGPVPDGEWVRTMAGTIGVPERALYAYAAADLRLAVELPGCDLSWATLAGIGYVESRHGTLAGRVTGEDGRPTGAPIIGIALDGAGAVAAVADTDDGRYDGDATWDRAVGPMQFIPGTWVAHGGDGDGDGAVDPQDIDDAAYTSGRYLCARAGPLTDPTQWRRAILAYNPSSRYVADVLAATNRYALASGA